MSYPDRTPSQHNQSIRTKCVFYCDNNKYSVQTYNKNFKENWKPTDIRTIKTSEIPEIDMLCGGFPCQAFSIAGQRKGFQDTRGTLFFEIARIIKSKKPKIIFLENVKGLLNHEKGKTFSIILQTISELGYDVQWMVLNSKFFGVPQNRERVFIIGSLRDECRPEILPFKQSDELDEKMEGQTEIIKIQSSGREMARVYDPKGISPTIRVPSGGWHLPNIKDIKIRKLTPIECERLQGFPDNWTKGVSYTQRSKQMGNTVTVNVIQAICLQLLRSRKCNKD